MKHYRKTLIGSIVAFFIGTSCCWLSSVVLWLGGGAFIGMIIKWVEHAQTQLILLSIILAIISMFLYQKKKRKKNPEH